MPDIKISELVAGGIKLDNSITDYRIRTMETTVGGKALKTPDPMYAANRMTLATILEHYYRGHFGNIGVRFIVRVEHDVIEDEINVTVITTKVGRSHDRAHVFTFKHANEAFNDKTLATLSLLI
jgi:hypothetical protein